MIGNALDHPAIRAGPRVANVPNVRLFTRISRIGFLIASVVRTWFDHLTLMLVVAKLANTKSCKKLKND